MNDTITGQPYIFGDEIVRLNGQTQLGRIYKVTSGRTPYKVRTADGKEYGCGQQHFTVITGAEAEAYRMADLERGATNFGTYALGTVVAFTEGKYANDGPYVICAAMNASGKVRVARLGGANNAYVNCTPAHLEVLTGTYTPNAS